MNIAYIIRNCLATLKMENIYPSAKAIQANYLFLTGKISSDQARQKIIDYHLKR